MQISSVGQAKQSRDWRRQAQRLAVDFVVLAILTVLFRASLAVAGNGDPSCANTGVTDAYQPQVWELASVLEAAASHSLGSNYEDPGLIWAGTGVNQVQVSATFPCEILKAIAYIESSWHQAAASVPRGSYGLPLTSYYGCGYGVMQITSPMLYPGQIDPAKQRRIAREYIYNVSYGAKMLADKWNTTPIIGNNNPNASEDWYYAVWAYNGFSWANNPNNPAFPLYRTPFDGSQSRLDYPYQELIWGYAANPPTIDGIPGWSPSAITLPPRNQITNPPGTIPDPLPTHAATCNNPPPPPTPTFTPSPTKTPAPTPPPTNTPTPTPTPVPVLSASATTMGFLAEPGKSANTQTLRLTSNWSPSLSWSLQHTCDTGWLSASPASGIIVPANVIISANMAIIAPGEKRFGSITITNLNNPSQPPWVVSVSAYVGSLNKRYFPLALKLGQP